MNFYFRDISDGGACKNNPMTGAPDSNCVFIISSTENGEVGSSYMAVPFLPSVSLSNNSEKVPSLENFLSKRTSIEHFSYH